MGLKKLRGLFKNPGFSCGTCQLTSILLKHRFQSAKEKLWRSSTLLNVFPEPTAAIWVLNEYKVPLAQIKRSASDGCQTCCALYRGILLFQEHWKSFGPPDTLWVGIDPGSVTLDVAVSTEIDNSSFTFPNEDIPIFKLEFYSSSKVLWASQLLPTLG